jgi:hypothetical protein
VERRGSDQIWGTITVFDWLYSRYIFNDAESRPISDTIWRGMIGRIVNNNLGVEGRDCSLRSKVISRNVPGQTVGDYEKPQSRLPVSRPRFEPGTSRLQVRIIFHLRQPARQKLGKTTCQDGWASGLKFEPKISRKRCLSVHHSSAKFDAPWLVSNGYREVKIVRAWDWPLISV